MEACLADPPVHAGLDGGSQPGATGPEILTCTGPSQEVKSPDVQNQSSGADFEAADFEVANAEGLSESPMTIPQHISEAEVHTEDEICKQQESCPQIEATVYPESEQQSADQATLAASEQADASALQPSDRMPAEEGIAEASPHNSSPEPLGPAEKVQIGPTRAMLHMQARKVCCFLGASNCKMHERLGMYLGAIRSLLLAVSRRLNAGACCCAEGTAASISCRSCRKH